MKNNPIILEEVNVNSLPELQGWREKQEVLVKDNPFIVISNHKTYEEAKKRRTALLKGRTEIQKQDKVIASKLKDFRSKVSTASEELIKITLPHEEKQQSEVKRYEELRAKEKAEKERLEAERKEKIKKSIDDIFNNSMLAINNLKFEDLKDSTFLDELNKTDTSIFDEFELDFEEKLQVLTSSFNNKKEQLKIAENQRIEDERLKKEREELEKQKRLAKEKAEKEAEKKRKEQERIDLENKKKADELAMREAKIEEEKKRLEKIESDRKAKEDAELKAKEATKQKEEEEARKKAEEEAKIKRAEALKPDKEKLQKVIESISITIEKPVLKDKEAIEFYNKLEEEIEVMKKVISNTLSNLK